MELLNSVRNMYRLYCSETVNLTFVFVILVAWLILRKKERSKICQYTMILLTLLLIPLAGFLFVCGGGSDTEKQMVYVCIPVVILLAVCFTDILESQQKRKLTVIVAGMICLQFLWELQYTDVGTKLLPAGRSLQAEVQQIHDICLEEDCRLVIAPDEVAAKIREEDLEISVVYGENYEYSAAPIENVVQDAERFGSLCVVVPRERMDLDYMEEQGYHTILETTHYYVQKRS